MATPWAGCVRTRDYLDVAALAEHYGVGQSADVLAHIDDYYTDQHGSGQGVAAQVARQLAHPHPADASVTRQLAAYRNLKPRWKDWSQVRAACRELATAMLEWEV